MLNNRLPLTLKCTFGWKIFVLKRTEGGTSGYCSGTLMDSSNVPPSNGVSVGPCSAEEQTSQANSEVVYIASIDIRVALRLSTTVTGNDLFHLNERTHRDGWCDWCMLLSDELTGCKR
jgi:hypothetical protein